MMLPLPPAAWEVSVSSGGMGGFGGGRGGRGNFGNGERPSFGDGQRPDGGEGMPDFGSGEIPDGGQMPDGGSSEQSYEDIDDITRNETTSGVSITGTYETPQDYIDALNANNELLPRVRSFMTIYVPFLCAGDSSLPALL